MSNYYVYLHAGKQSVGTILLDDIAGLETLKELAELSLACKGREREIDLGGSYQATKLLYEAIVDGKANYGRVPISIRAEFTMLMIRWVPEMVDFLFLQKFILDFNKSYGTRLRTRGERIEFYNWVRVIYDNCEVLRRWLDDFDPDIATEEEIRKHREQIERVESWRPSEFKLSKYHDWSCLDIESFLPYIDKFKLLIYYLENPQLRQYIPCVEMPRLQDTHDIMDLVYRNSCLVDNAKMIPALCDHYGKNILYFWPDNKLTTRSVVTDKIHHCFSLSTPRFHVITENGGCEEDQSRVQLRLVNGNLSRFLCIFKLPNVILEFSENRFYCVDNMEYDDGKITFLQNEKDITDYDISVDIWSRPGVIISISLILHETPL